MGDLQVKMATRSSGRTRFPVKRLINEVYKHSEKISTESRKKKDYNLYDVSVVEIDARSKRIKVHYVGWDSKFDEWKNCKDGDFPLVKYQRLKLPPPETIHQRSEMFCQTLSCEIKRNLCFGWKDNPEVRIRLKIDEDVYRQTFKKLGIPVKRASRKGEMEVMNNRSLDENLGIHWDRRIKNRLGDFSFVSSGTVRFWFRKKNPIKDYFEVGRTFLPYEIEQEPILVFTFVRAAGNRNCYDKMFGNK